MPHHSSLCFLCSSLLCLFQVSSFALKFSVSLSSKPSDISEQMSCRGGSGDGGRGRGGQPWPGPPSQRGGGRGRSNAPPSVQPSTTTTSSSQPPQSIREVGSSSTSTVPSAAAASLSEEVADKLMIQPLPPPPASSKSLRFPRRPGYGTIGQKCVVKANHFLVRLQDRPLHHYDVSISPEVTSRGVNRMVMRQLVSQYNESHMGQRKPVYDGRKSLFTAGALPFNSKEFVIKLADSDSKGKGIGKGNDGKGARRNREFKVTIKLAAQADLHHLEQFLRGQQLETPQEVIQILDVVLREVPSNNYTVVGRSFFDEKLGRKSEVGDGLECWKGFYQSLRPTQMGMSLNIDVSATTFYEEIPVIDFVMKYLNPRDKSRPLSDADRVKIKKALRGVKVELMHLENKQQKILGLSPLATNELKFDVDGKSISVVTYFQQKYQIKLQFGHWPALQAGNDSRPIYLPMELCKIVKGQRYSKKLTDKQVTAILRAACQRPNDRQRSIEEMVLHNKYEDDEYANEFGIKVANSLTAIPGARVLPPPWLQYHNSGKDSRIQPRVGQWNMINARMHEGGNIQHWACVTFSQRLHPNDAFAFFRELTITCGRKGMAFNPTPVLPMQSARADQIERTLTEFHNQCTKKIASSGGKGQLQLVIIILPDFSGSYGRIKRVCEIDLGLVSQCCQPKHAGRINPQYLENVALKINVKAGGRNNVLADFLQHKIPLVTDVPTIIFGADVTHPQPGEDSNPSIAAVVASMDWPHVTKYRGLVSAQPHRQELIQDLYKVVQDPERGALNAGMIRELLISFKSSTGQKPHRIIFYRDGVSEGQFSQVLLHEVDAIRKACNSLEVGYLPPMTFVVVQKRHHTRLFPNNHGDRNTTDKSGNVLPGTVVDTMICHPSEFDFYLCSHAGIQGTSRPTHYHVLWDENHFTADALQMLTNNLCYTYARCTRSVSVVPPAYYAHLAAFRARYYVENYTYDSHSGSTEVRGTRQLNAAVRPLPKIKDNVKDVMFYC